MQKHQKSKALSMQDVVSYAGVDFSIMDLCNSQAMNKCIAENVHLTHALQFTTMLTILDDANLSKPTLLHLCSKFIHPVITGHKS